MTGSVRGFFRGLMFSSAFLRACNSVWLVIVVYRAGVGG